MNDREQYALEAEIEVALCGTGATFDCTVVAMSVCVTLSLEGECVRGDALARAHADIVNAVDVAGYKPSVVVLP